MKLRVLTLNIHKGIAAHRPRLILQQLRSILQRQRADVLLLQEVVGQSRKLSERYKNYPTSSQFEYLADSVWPFYAYGRNAVSEHSDHGNAILSRFPIKRWSNLDISVPGKEYRSCLNCVLEVPDAEDITVGSVHLGLTRRERQQQLLQIKEMLPECSKAPVVLGGDFNDWRGSELVEFEAHTGLQEAHRHKHGHYCRTFPAYMPFLPLDRIYTRNMRILGCTRALGSWSRLSDHLALMAVLDY